MKVNGEQLLSEIYWARGYVSQEMFERIAEYLKVAHINRKYEPQYELKRDADELIKEIKNLEMKITFQSGLIGRILKKIEG